MKRYAIRLVAMPLAMMTCLCLLGCQTTGGEVAAGPQEPEFTKLIGQPTGLLIEPVDALKLGYSVDWVNSLNIRGNEKIQYVAVLGDMLVTVESPDNVITAIDYKAGKLLWRTAIGGPHDRAFAPGRVDDTILVNTESQLFKLDAKKNGALIGRDDLSAAVNGGPAMIGEYAVFGGSNGLVFGHDSRVGYSKWKYKLPAQILVPAQASGAQVFVAGADGQYVMFQGRNGEILWRGRVHKKVSATPAVTSVGVFVPSEDNNMYCLHRSTGEDRWIFRYTAALTESPIQLQNAVYLPLPTGELVSLKVTDGAENWRLKTTDKLVTQDARGLVFNAGNKLILRDPRSSKVAEEIPVKGTLQHVIIGEDRALVVVSPQGRIMKLSPVK